MRSILEELFYGNAYPNTDFRSKDEQPKARVYRATRGDYATVEGCARSALIARFSLFYKFFERFGVPSETLFFLFLLRRFWGRVTQFSAKVYV